MPSEWEFAQAARHLRAERDRIGQAASVLATARDRPTLSGGAIAPVVLAGLEVSVANARRAVSQLDDLATLCDRRAAVCAGHAAALLQWHRRQEHWDEAMRRHRADPTLPHPGPAPVRPVPPYAWVEPR